MAGLPGKLLLVHMHGMLGSGVRFGRAMWKQGSCCCSLFIIGLLAAAQLKLGGVS